MQHLEPTSGLPAASGHAFTTFDPRAIRIELGRAAENLIEKLDIHSAPISFDDLERIAALRRIQRISRVSLNCPGVLIPMPGGFIVQLNSVQSDALCRTSLAHEIGHTFFYDLDHETPRPVFWKSDGNRNVKAEEGLSWEAARNLLVPKKILFRWLDAEKRWPRIEGFLSTIKKFDVSPQIMIRRLQDLESAEPGLLGDAIIYRIDVSRAAHNGVAAVATTKPWKFGKMKKYTAYNETKKNSRVLRLLEVMHASPTNEPRESNEIIVRGELGQIPTGRYDIGCCWETGVRSTLLVIVSTPRRRE